MKSSELRGFLSVFKFTLTQTLKQKSYIITLVIMMLFAIGVFPVTKLVGSSKEKEDTSIERVYYINETNLNELSLDKMTEKYDYIEDVEFIKSEEDLDSICEMIGKAAEDEAENENPDANAIVVDAKLDMETGGYIFSVYYSPNSSISEDDAGEFATDLSEWFTEYKISVMDVNDEILDEITREVTSEVVEYDEFVADDEVVVISSTEYNLVYVILMVFYMVIVMCASMVSNKVVEEKANRIVEYLMTNIRPMALMLGKITAMLVAGVGEVVLILVSGFASYKISETIWPSEEPGVMGQFISFDAIKGLGVSNVVLCILIMIIGVVMYGLIAGLFGASVSKMEEVQQGLQIFTIIILVAFFASLIGINFMWSFGINAYVKTIMFIPFTSVMVLPGVILIGEASVLEIVLSIAIMIATTILFLWFVSLIYESVIVNNGNVISVKTMFKMAKDSLKKEKEVAKDEEK